MILWILHQAFHVAEVPMQVDDAGHDILAREIHRVVGFRCGRFRLRTCISNPPVRNHHRRVGNGGFARAVNQGEVLQHDRLGRGCTGCRKQSYQATIHRHLLIEHFQSELNDTRPRRTRRSPFRFDFSVRHHSGAGPEYRSSGEHPQDSLQDGSRTLWRATAPKWVAVYHRRVD
jgi:hypothetical protein